MNTYAEIVNNLLIKANCFCVEDFVAASGLPASKARLLLMELEKESAWLIIKKEKSDIKTCFSREDSHQMTKESIRI